MANTIATAVEQQSSAKNEISRNISGASEGSNEIAESIAGVAKSNRDTTSSVAMLQEATQEVGRMAEQLDRMARKFQVADGETPGKFKPRAGSAKGA